MVPNKIYYVIFLLLFELVSAYPYSDFVRQSNYLVPQPPTDSLIGNSCDSLPIDSDLCKLILNDPALNSSDKKNFILSALNPNNKYPQFDAMKQWNEKIQYTKYPLNSPVSKGSIKDAWIKIVEFYPSVTENKTVLLNKTGTIKSAFGFSYVLPDNPIPGECGYEYEPEGYDFNITTKLNNQKINKNNEKISDYNLINKENNFESILTIEAAYKVIFYRQHTSCTTNPKGEKSCSISCDYEGYERRVDKLEVSDSQKTQFYKYSYHISSFVDSNFSGLYDLWLTFDIPNDFAELSFQSDNAHLVDNGMDYFFKSDNAFNTLHFETQEDNSVDSYHFSILNKSNEVNTTKVHAFTLASSNCDLSLRTHFEYNQISTLCNQTGLNSSLQIFLEKADNSSFRLRIRLSDNLTNNSLVGENVIVRYANNEKIFSTDSNGEVFANFNYIIGHNTVEAVFQTDLTHKSAKKIFIIPSSLVDIKELVFKILIFAVILFIIYTIAKKGVSYAG